MSDAKPTVRPELLAELTSGAPKRIIKKLDDAPSVARDWDWAVVEGAWTISTGSEAVVVLRPHEGVLGTMDHARCSCLLAPRCLHLIAVLRVLELDDAVEGAAPKVDSPSPASLPATLTLESAQREAAALALRSGEEVLVAGGRASGTLLQGELLRAVHACRISGLHRLSAAGLRLARSVRNLHDDKPEFALDDLHADLAAYLETALVLAEAETVAERRVGTARREYGALGSLRVHGLLSEAVVTRGGYAGVVTYLCDDQSRLWALSDVRPGVATRAIEAYGGGVSIGDCTLSHRELGRDGLFLSAGTGSADGRLGAGSGVRAVRAGSSSLADEPCTKLFARSLDEQIAAAREAQANFPEDRRAGDDLVFVTAVVVGTQDGMLLLATTDQSQELRLRSAHDAAELPGNENLQVLCRAPGLKIRLVARLLDDRRRVFAPLLVAPHEPDDGVPSFSFPESWASRCCLTLDRLEPRHLVRLVSRAPEIPPPRSEVPDPLEAFRRRLRNFALGGVRTVSERARDDIERDARQLEKRMMPEAARSLRALAQASVQRERDVLGRRGATEARLVALAWLRCAIFERGTRSHGGDLPAR
jgi:hypothetical protein